MMTIFGIAALVVWVYLAAKDFETLQRWEDERNE